MERTKATDLPASRGNLAIYAGRSLNLRANGNVKLRVVLFHVVDTVFIAKLLDDCSHSFGLGNGSGFDFSFLTAGIDPNRGILLRVLVPLRIRALNRQQIKFVAFQYEPDWIGDCTSRLSSRNSNLDFAISRKPVF